MTDATQSTAAPKLSPVEGIKDESCFLFGDIGPEMKDGNEFFGKGSEVLLKFHGTYQQDDRDERGAVAEDGKKKKSFIFMVRSRIPGGKLTSEQLLEQLKICDEIGNTTLRITSRQALQLHGVLKSNLKQAIRRINDSQLSTLAACGDVNRNVMCCPAPYKNNLYRETQELAHQIAMHFAPRTKAYHELWLTDTDTGVKELVGGGDPAGDGFDVEPIYGKHYMPRKFKMGVGFDFDNCVDLYSQDLGLMAITQGDKILGYNVLVGGGFGVTPSAKKTFPHLGKKLTFATPENVISVVEAVFKVQRDFGNREDRKVARLKYVVASWGIEKFKEKVEEYYGSKLPEPHASDVRGFNDHIGWDEQGDGNWFYGLNVENGRIKDTAQIKLKSAIREVCQTLKPGIRLTSHQSILFTDIKPEDKDKLIAILKKYNVTLSEEISMARRYSMACVAWPTCGLSITESERALPGIIDHIEVALAKLGLASERFTIRMTGCPNGCARPYNSDVGLVGKAKGKYTLFLGGRLLGDRLNFIFKDMVPEEEVASTLLPVFAYFKQAREANETLGDFCHRKGLEDLTAFANQFSA